MSIRSSLFLVAWLVSTPWLSWGQQVAASRLPPSVGDLANKTFAIGEAAESSPAGNDVQHYFIFHPDGRATFRETRGNTVVKDSPLGWQLVGDSLFLQPGPVRMQVEGKTQPIDREPIKQAIRKVSGGYLLTQKQEQMLLREVK
ncbi:hypothetical protein SAMN00120144_4230 [Hymenobacter roseosalivarius DSM 11622]|uniref:Lipocalin-like domain-containing protein n=1 Tax=Hymenobacter roseosalivarius DSM 11622 TaxID=645990 RepID=A0A1W1UFD7_9BACT|nr:hypothetical protein [Hymenobacter roseosalivarius]SMB79818.1 hypothetical protein SAMN00120144_4230 [Hymenobacter roseosalivarius DSM 11622]